jgi:hypothetical protein
MMHHMRVFRNLSGREFAGSSSPGAIRDIAANRLRIIPYGLLLQMKQAIDSAIKFHDLHGCCPPT